MVSIKGYHHLTACVAGAQQDVDFYVHLLGQRLVKKTVLLDGTQPIYHLYYGNPDGDPGTIVTSFPYKQKGVKGRRGSGQIKTINYSVPVGSLPFWRERFVRHGVDHSEQFLEFVVQPDARRRAAEQVIVAGEEAPDLARILDYRLPDAQIVQGDALAVEHPKDVVVGLDEESGGIWKWPVVGEPGGLGVAMWANNRQIFDMGVQGAGNFKSVRLCWK